MRLLLLVFLRLARDTRSRSLTVVRHEEGMYQFTFRRAGLVAVQEPVGITKLVCFSVAVLFYKKEQLQIHGMYNTCGKGLTETRRRPVR